MIDEKNKTVVFDTSALIENPEILRDYASCNIVIPAIVLKQLDGLKKHEILYTAFKAQSVSKIIDELQKEKAKIVFPKQYNYDDYLSSKADNIVISIAEHYKLRGNNICLVTTDRNMKIVAENKGIKVKTVNKNNGVSRSTGSVVNRKKTKVLSAIYGTLFTIFLTCGIFLEETFFGVCFYTALFGFFHIGGSFERKTDISYVKSSDDDYCHHRYYNGSFFKELRSDPYAHGAQGISGNTYTTGVSPFAFLDDKEL